MILNLWGDRAFNPEESRVFLTCKRESSQKSGRKELRLIIWPRKNPLTTQRSGDECHEELSKRASCPPGLRTMQCIPEVVDASSLRAFVPKTGDLNCGWTLRKSLSQYDWSSNGNLDTYSFTTCMNKHCFKVKWRQGLGTGERWRVTV